ncbi:type I secretion protein TolC, partial [Candidatus Endoriftia persephone str. Guaymas]|nr:type I secretion protein TolC [Candidatus Endoriftia persephone str. Guaymas]
MKLVRLVLPLLLAGAALSVQAKDLMDVYKLAQENDPALQVAKSQLDAVRETKVQARAQLLPSIALGGQFDGVRSDVKSSPFSSTGVSTYNDRSLNLSLSQSIYHRDQWIRLEQA